jgi:hypothetical protein
LQVQPKAGLRPTVFSLSKKAVGRPFIHVESLGVHRGSSWIMPELMFAFQVKFKAAGKIEPESSGRSLILDIVRRSALVELNIGTVIDDEVMPSSKRQASLYAWSKGGRKVTPSVLMGSQHIIRVHFGHSHEWVQPDRPN